MLIPIHNTVKVIIEKNNMYIQKAIVKISPSEHLQILDEALKLGYSVLHSNDWERDYKCFVYNTFFSNNSLVITPTLNITRTKPYYLEDDYFDCKDNLKAFLKIIAMRNDTDKDQYFVDEEGAEWVNLGMRVEPGSLEKCLTDKKVVCFNTPKYHRASAQEIFDFFEKYKNSTL